MILIKGMEMPENCTLCPIITWYDGEGDYVCPFSGVSALNIGRQDDCPLVEVPPHGRLIDADELLERFNVEQKAKDMHGRGFASCFENCGELCTEWWCAEEIVENAPTVIPADSARK